MVICLERGADLHMSQPMPLPLTVSCFSDIQIGFTFLVPAHLVSPGKKAIQRVCVCMHACLRVTSLPGLSWKKVVIQCWTFVYFAGLWFFRLFESSSRDVVTWVFKVLVLNVWVLLMVLRPWVKVLVLDIKAYSVTVVNKFVQIEPDSITTADSRQKVFCDFKI